MSLYRPRILALLVIAIGCAFATRALAQAGADTPPMPTPLQWIAITCAILGAFSVLMTTVGQGLTILAMKWPELANASHHFLAWGYDVQKFVDGVRTSTSAKAGRLEAAKYGDPSTFQDAPIQPPTPLTTITRPLSRPPPPRADGFVLVRVLTAITLVALLGVSVVELRFRSLPLPTTALEGCTPAQSAQNIATALTATQALCAAAQADAPTFGAAPLTMTEIAVACKIGTGLETLIQEAIDNFGKQKAAARTTMSARAARMTSPGAATPR